MPNLIPVDSFDDVYQLERTDPVDAGVNGAGISNKQAQALANRTLNLKNRLDGLGSAAAQPVSAFATAGQGVKADGALQSTQLAQPNGVATLDATGKVPTSQIPTIAIGDVYSVASQAAQLALVAHSGDFCVRTDQDNTWYVQNGGTTGTMTDWSEVTTPQAIPSDAPSDDNPYVRKNGAWVPLTIPPSGLQPVTNTWDMSAAAENAAFHASVGCTVANGASDTITPASPVPVTVLGAAYEAAVAASEVLVTQAGTKSWQVTLNAAASLFLAITPRGIDLLAHLATLTLDSGSDLVAPPIAADGFALMMSAPAASPTKYYAYFTQAGLVQRVMIPCPATPAGGDIIVLSYNWTTGALSMTINGGTAIALGNFVISDIAQPVASIVVVGAAGSVPAITTTLAPAGAAFQQQGDAVLPAGAADGDRYLVSVAGRLGSTYTAVNDVVELRNGATDLVVIQETDLAEFAAQQQLEILRLLHTASASEPATIVLIPDTTDKDAVRTGPPAAGTETIYQCFLVPATGYTMPAGTAAIGDGSWRTVDWHIRRWINGSWVATNISSMQTPQRLVLLGTPFTFAGLSLAHSIPVSYGTLGGTTPSAVAYPDAATIVGQCGMSFLPCAEDFALQESLHAALSTYTLYTAPAISNPPTQAEVQGVADATAAISALLHDLTG